MDKLIDLLEDIKTYSSSINSKSFFLKNRKKGRYLVLLSILVGITEILSNMNSMIPESFKNWIKGLWDSVIWTTIVNNIPYILLLIVPSTLLLQSLRFRKTTDNFIENLLIYQKDLMKHNIIHLAHLDKVYAEFFMKINYINQTFDSLNELSIKLLDVGEKFEPNVTETVEENIVALTNSTVNNFQKNLCRSFKAFLKDIFIDLQELIEETVTSSNVHQTEFSIVLFSNTNKILRVYDAFVDEKTFLMACYDKNYTDDSYIYDTKVTEKGIKIPLSNKSIKNSSNCVYGFLEYTYKGKNEYELNDLLQHLLIENSEIISYYINQLCKYIEDSNTAKNSNEIDPMEIIHKHFTE
ncbi:hypothetical protein [Enterococcus sp. AZ192]|uniref:hypothetical protein n=1 Tax=unclassified Enterococcus TaxID=2608891 RepID=UPI003D277A06